MEAFVREEVDLVWQGPLAYIKIRQRLSDGSRIVTMRDMDVNCTTEGIIHPDAAIHALQDLQGKRSEGYDIWTRQPGSRGLCESLSDPPPPV